MAEISYKKYHLLFPVLAAILVFSGTFEHGFVNWDDPANFLENPWIASPDMGLFERLAGIFSSDVLGNYNPLSNASFLIDKALFGFDNPGGWHLINVLLHAVVTSLVFFVILRISKTALVAFTAALIFAVHPLHVESVAWVTERKDVLYSCFYFAAMLWYLKYREKPQTSKWIILHLFFILSLLSKIQAVALPLSLLVVDYFYKGRIEFRDITAKWSLFLLSLITGVAGILILSDQGSLTMGEEKFTLLDNLSFGSYSLAMYMFKVLVPYPLSSYYAYPETISWPYYLSLLTLPVLIYALYLIYKKGYRDLFFGLGFFFVNIIFVAQFLKAGQGFMADRFMYIPILGLIYILVVYWNKYFIRTNRSGVGFILLGLFVAVLAFVSFRQAKVWSDGNALWTNVIRHYPDKMRPYAARGNYFYRNGQLDRALADYNKALAIKQNHEILSNRAKVYMQQPTHQNRWQLALADLNRAIALEGNEGEYFLNRFV